MNRNTFINQLFDNGQGLTLDQILDIENRLSNSKDNKNMVYEMCNNDDSLELYQARELVTEQKRDLFMENLNKCNDLLELRSFLQGYFDYKNYDLTDMQVYRLSYLK